MRSLLVVDGVDGGSSEDVMIIECRVSVQIPG